MKKHVVIAIPSMVVDEVKEKKFQVLCKFLLEKGDSEAFLSTLGEYVGRIATEGFTVRVSPIPAVFSTCRWGFAYFVDREDELIMSEMLKMYITKGGRYYSTLQNIHRYLKDKLGEGKVDEILEYVESELESENLNDWVNKLKEGEIGWRDFSILIELCCKVITERRKCQVYGHCKKIVGMLPDILITTSAFRLAHVHRGMKVILVTEDTPLREVVNKVAQRFSLEVRASNIENIAKELQKS